MYMPGRLRTASRPSSTVMLLASYESAGGVDGVGSEVVKRGCEKLLWERRRSKRQTAENLLKRRDFVSLCSACGCAFDARVLGWFLGRFWGHRPSGLRRASAATSGDSKLRNAAVCDLKFGS